MSDSEPNLRLGRFVETTAASETVRAFVPPPLPPEPSIDVLSLLERLSLAERALGRLDGITMLLPRQELFLYMYVGEAPRIQESFGAPRIGLVARDPVMHSSCHHP